MAIHRRPTHTPMYLLLTNIATIKKPTRPRIVPSKGKMGGAPTNTVVAPSLPSPPCCCLSLSAGARAEAMKVTAGSYTLSSPLLIFPPFLVHGCLLPWPVVAWQRGQGADLCGRWPDPCSSTIDPRTAHSPVWAWPSSWA